MGFGKGVAVGLGVAFLIAGIAGLIASWYTYQVANQYQQELNNAYSLTHSQRYSAVIDGLEAIEKTANITLYYIGKLPLPGTVTDKIVNFMEKAHEYRTTLENVRSATEEVNYRTMYDTVSLTQTASVSLAALGAILTITGTVLEVRERRKA